MKQRLAVVILAAGFGNRIKPVWDGPKGLIPYRGRSILEHLLGELAELEQEYELSVVVVSNERDMDRYAGLVKGVGLQVQVVSDGARSAEEARGAVRDLLIGVGKIERASDVLVLPCDTIFRGTLDLSELVEFAREKNGVTVVVRCEKKEYIAGRFGNVKVGEKERVVEFVEKPSEPISEWAAAAIYYYPESELGLVNGYLAEGGNAENPGRVLSYLLAKGRPVYAFRVQPGMVDVGKPEELELINGEEMIK